MKALDIKSIASAINRFLEVPILDPDERRRSWLLNVLLLSALALSVLTLQTTIIVGLFDWVSVSSQLYVMLPILIVGVGFVYILNRFVSGRLACILFLLIMIAAVAFSDEPEQVASGRSLVSFAFPIVMASMILSPSASFAAAGISSLAIVALAQSIHIPADPFPMLAFFAVALVSWLGARTMERAIRGLRLLTLELEDRVRDRTRDLAESLSKTEAILDSTVDGIVVFDTEGRATVANPATASLLGASVDEIVGSGIKELVSDSMDADVSSVKLECGGKTLAVTAAPVHLESGEEIGTVAVFHDFTQEAEVDRMKSTFLSIASHDLRSPLGAVLGLTELVREGVYATLEEQRDAIDRIYSNTQYMLSLANSLLGRAQIEAGILQLRSAPFSPADLVANVIDAMQVQARDKGIELVTHVAGDVPDMVTGDREKVSQVLFNLVGNGIKFTDEGSVEIHACAHDDEHLTLVVSDTGCGISGDDQSIVFEPFRRAEGTSAAGVGLGLSIVKQLVELMGGEIHLESRVGQGSTFTVILPIDRPPMTNSTS
jgi:signal transduction histidine kinase